MGIEYLYNFFLYLSLTQWMYLVGYGTVQYETMECNGMDGRGLPAPKSDDSLVPLSIGTSWHTTETTPTR